MVTALTDPEIVAVYVPPAYVSSYIGTSGALKPDDTQRQLIGKIYARGGNHALLYSFDGAISVNTFTASAKTHLLYFAQLAAAWGIRCVIPIGNINTNKVSAIEDFNNNVATTPEEKIYWITEDEWWNNSYTDFLRVKNTLTAKHASVLASGGESWAYEGHCKRNGDDYPDDVGLSNVVAAGATTNCTTASPHNFTNGQSVRLTGVTGFAANPSGVFVATVTGASTFSITHTAGAGTYGGGATVNGVYVGTAELRELQSLLDVHAIHFYQLKPGYSYGRVRFQDFTATVRIIAIVSLESTTLAPIAPNNFEGNFEAGMDAAGVVLYPVKGYTEMFQYIAIDTNALGYLPTQTASTPRFFNADADADVVSFCNLVGIAIFHLGFEDGRPVKDGITMMVYPGPNQAYPSPSGNISIPGSYAYDDWLPSGSPITYSWTVLAKPAGATVSFNDATLLRPVFNFNCLIGGTYTLQITATKGGVTESATFNLVTSGPAGTPPVANFSGTPLTIVQGSTVAFTDSSTNLPTSWLWAFPGGTPSSSTSQNPTVTYNTPGIYSVTLQATNAFGTGSLTRTAYITVNALTPPVANFSGAPTAIQEGDTVNFIDASSNTPTSWLWTFTGGTPSSSTSQNPSVVYPTAGTYDVSLQVTNADGSDTLTRVGYIVVTAIPPPPTPPVADFTGSPTTIIQGGSVSFLDASSNTPTSWAWIFAGGTPATSSVQNPTVVYNTPGTYDVELQVTNADGSDTETKVGYITVLPTPTPPVADFTASTNSICQGGSVDFTDSSTNTPTSWAWSFPGSLTPTSILQNPTGVVYTSAGVYTVRLVATNADGSDSEVKIGFITVNAPGMGGCPGGTPLPVADFDTPNTNICIGDTVTFRDLSTQSPTAWAWSFPGGTPNSSSVQNPTVTYPTAGVYDVRLTVSNITGNDTKVRSGYIIVSDCSGGGGVTPPSFAVFEIRGPHRIGADIMGTWYLFTNLIGNFRYTWYLNGQQIAYLTDTINLSTLHNGDVLTVRVENLDAALGTWTEYTTAPFIVNIISKPPLPIVYPGGTVQLPPNGFVILTSNSPLKNKWSTGKYTPSIMVTTPGVYCVEAIDEFGNSSGTTCVTVVARAGVVLAELPVREGSDASTPASEGGAQPQEIPGVDLRLDNPYSTGSVINYGDSLSSLNRRKIRYKADRKDQWHIVTVDDTIWDISFKYYNNSKYYWVIVDVNNLENCFELPVGKTLLIPDLIKLRLK